MIGIGPIGRASLGWALGYYLFPGEVKTVEAGPITIVVLMAVGLSLIGFVSRFNRASMSQTKLRGLINTPPSFYLFIYFLDALCLHRVLHR